MSDIAKTKVLITGATGMLGRSILRCLSSSDPNNKYECLGTGFSRVNKNDTTTGETTSNNIVKLDLLSSSDVTTLLNDFQPNIVIHSAAERRPDVAANDPKRTMALNVDSTRHLANECQKVKSVSLIIYISTEYVFDGGIESGVFPPYATNAKTNPISDYGTSKLMGEDVVKSVTEAGGCLRSMAVRIPVLYAYDCQFLEESASLVVAKALLEKNAIKVDNWGMRFPTAVDDISAILKCIIDQQELTTNSSTIERKQHETIHISSPECCTKYELGLLMGDIMNVETSHIQPDDQAPKGAKRPKNTQLNCAQTWQLLGMSEPFPFVSLKEGMKKALHPFQAKFSLKTS